MKEILRVSNKEQTFRTETLGICTLYVIAHLKPFHQFRARCGSKQNRWTWTERNERRPAVGWNCSLIDLEVSQHPQQGLQQRTVHHVPMPLLHRAVSVILLPITGISRFWSPNAVSTDGNITVTCLRRSYLDTEHPSPSIKLFLVPYASYFLYRKAQGTF